MARLIRQTRRSNEAGTDDLDIVIAEDVLQIGGREVHVREYSLVQSLRHRAELNALVEALRSTFASSGTDNSLETILDIMSQQEPLVFRLVALSCEQSVEWIQSLPTADGEQLLFSWWTVNGDFFVRALVRPAIQKAALAGLTSLQPSSQPDTIQSASPTTPPAS